jgi:hypothetical protein
VGAGALRGGAVRRAAAAAREGVRAVRRCRVLRGLAGGEGRVRRGPSVACGPPEARPPLQESRLLDDDEIADREHAVDDLRGRDRQFDTAV